MRLLCDKIKAQRGEGMTVFENIDKEIARQNKSRRKVAIEAGIAPSTFQSIMERQRSISFEKLQKIAAALNVSLDALDPVAAARKELTDSLFSMVLADEESGRSWTISDWVKNRDEQVKAIAEKYSIDSSILNNAVPMASSLSTEFWASQNQVEHYLTLTSYSKAWDTYREIPNDWRKDAAIQAAMDIIKKRFGADGNDKIFTVLMGLYHSEDEYLEELVKRLETLAYSSTAKSNNDISR